MSNGSAESRNKLPVEWGQSLHLLRDLWPYGRHTAYQDFQHKMSSKVSSCRPHNLKTYLESRSNEIDCRCNSHYNCSTTVLSSRESHHRANESTNLKHRNDVRWDVTILCGTHIWKMEVCVERWQDNDSSYHAHVISKHPSSYTCQCSEHVDTKVAWFSRYGINIDLYLIGSHLRHWEKQMGNLDCGALNALKLSLKSV